MESNRIKSLDGLRAFCAIGVVWIHVFTMYGRPSFNLFGLDIFKPLIILGNGVDFFFVISGFCLYLVLHDKKPGFRMALKFLWNRFWRIAPAFYVAVLIYSFYLRGDFEYHVVNCSIWAHLFFVSNYTNVITISGPFWSIVTEWSFYLLLPLVLLGIPKIRFSVQIVIFILLSLLFSVFMYWGYFSVHFWETNILTRFPEFAVGILACHFFIKGLRLPHYLKGFTGILLFIFITYAGRIMGYTVFFKQFGIGEAVIHSLCNMVMTGGFALLMFHIITERSRLQIFLKNRISSFLGKISYSIYLWHSLLISLLHYLITKSGSNQFGMLLSFMAVVILTIPFSYLSFLLLERIYHKFKLKLS